jgi:ketosteroid isomerase-like protein
MSQESIEALIRSGHDAFNRGDLDAFIDVWDEECEYQPAWELDMAGEDSFRGHEGIRRWWQEMSDAWSDWETEVHEVRAVGDQVFISVTLRARGRLSGARMEATFFQAITLRAGKVLTLREFADRRTALEAAGLRE